MYQEIKKEHTKKLNFLKLSWCIEILEEKGLTDHKQIQITGDAQS